MRRRVYSGIYQKGLVILDPKIQEMLEKLKAAAHSIGQNAERGAKYAGKKAGDIWDAGKLNIRILELKGDMSLLYETLGKLVHSVHKGKEVQDAEIEEKIAALDEKGRELARLQKKLCQMRGQKVCPSCQMKCGETDAYCRRCGAPLGTKNDA